MSTETLIHVTLGLVVAELIGTLVLFWTRSHYRAALQRHLDGRVLETLGAEESKAVVQVVGAEYNRTIYRKIELLVIAFHLPALASWSMATRQNRTPPIYYYGVTMLFWLIVCLVGAKAIAAVRGA